MKPTALALCVSLAALGNVATAAPDFAQVNQILTKNGCLACHGVDKKIIGPAYTEVAKKRQGEADVAALLTKHIKEGSQGVYGPIA
ncbi:MAG: cytochrome C, partial [Candidimonas sp.]